MKKFNIILILFLILIINLPKVYSQGGSNYSILGIGDINYGGNVAYLGLSGTQIAMPLDNSINSRNPAMWGFVSNTRLQAGYKFNQNIVTNENNTIWHNNGSITGFSGIFAIDSAMGISASFGIVPYSNINYLTSTKFSITQTGLTLNGETIYQGKGGISQAYIGASTQIFDWLGIGASVFTSFGVVENSSTTKFYDDIYSFTYINTKSDYVSGYGTKAGLYVTPAENFMLGFSLELQPKLSISSETKYDANVLADTLIKSESELKIPALIGFGASYKSGIFMFGADLSFQDFSSFDYSRNASTKFTSAMSASVGIVRFGNESLNAPILDRTAYKFGMAYNKLYYEILGSNIQEYSASLGMQMPFTGTLVVDFSVSGGMRLAGDSRLVNEYFARFGIDLSIGETWFVPFKREY